MKWKKLELWCWVDLCSSSGSTRSVSLDKFLTSWAYICFSVKSGSYLPWWYILRIKWESACEILGVFFKKLLIFPFPAVGDLQLLVYIRITGKLGKISRPHSKRFWFSGSRLRPKNLSFKWSPWVILKQMINRHTFRSALSLVLSLALLVNTL